MNVQPRYSTLNHPLRTGLVIMGLTLAFVSGAAVTRLAQPALAPLAPPAALPANVAPAVVAPPALARPATANRFFQDEINAAATLDLSDQTLAGGALPERLSDPPQAAGAVRAHFANTRPATTNRFFMDEIGGAGALDLTSAAGAVQPEWDQAPLPAAAPVVAPQPPITAANRFFADEIAAGVGLADWTIPDVPAIVTQHGPR